MRYIILKESISKDEYKSRKKYIEKATRLFFKSHKIDGGIEFESFPSSAIDCLMIVGHNNKVEEYLENAIIPESYIAVVSCKFSINRKMYKTKKIYVSYDDKGITDHYDGREWNLNFNISKEELKLINSTGSFIEKIEKCFRRINNGKSIRKNR